MEALKACPFCGTNDRTDFAVEWRECACGATGPDGAEAWNRRPIEDALRAERDAAVARAEAAETALAAARAEGAAVERAAVVAYIKTHRDIADKRGGQHVGTGPNPSVQRFMLRILVPDLECGEHTRP